MHTHITSATRTAARRSRASPALLRTAASDADMALPRVHVYPHRLMIPTPMSIFAPYGFHSAGGSNFMNIFSQRLLELDQAPADAADLFFAFLPPYAPPLVQYSAAEEAAIKAMGPDDETYVGNHQRFWVQAMCRHLADGKRMRALMPHIRPSNLHRHVLLTPCPIHTCDSERAHGANLTERIPKWVSHIHLSLDADNLAPRRSVHSRPRSINVPYISSVRWSRQWTAPPWRGAGAGRRHLVSFTGSMRGRPESKALRKVLLASCARAARGVCSALVTGRFPILQAAEADELANMRRALRLKATSTFCLEPPGFSPPRKSMIDSMLSGCIPVTFYTDEQLRHLMPFHFGGWGLNATLRLDAAAVTRGDIDVIETLAALPAAHVASLRRAIAADAHRLVYAFGSYPDDAVETVLRALGDATAAAGPRAAAP